MMLAAVVLLALQFSTNKAYSLRCGSTARASLTFTTIAGLLSSVVSLIIALATGEGFRVTTYSLIMAALVAIFCCTYTFIGFKIMSLGNMSVYTMFLMLGGMLLPYFFGVFWLGEDVSAARIIGVLLLIFSMAFPVISKNKEGKSSVIFIVLCLAVFMLNGCVSISSKIHQINEVYDSVGSASFSCISNFINCIISACGLAVITSKNKKSDADREFSEKFSVNKKAVALIVTANAACNGVSYMLQLVSAGKLDASVMYPMMTGGSVVLSAIAGFIFFREKPDKISLIGLVLSFAATFLFLF